MGEAVGQSAEEDVGDQFFEEEGGGVLHEHEEEEGGADFEEVPAQGGEPANIYKGEIAVVFFLNDVLVVVIENDFYLFEGNSMIVDLVAVCDSHQGLVGVGGVG